MLLHALRKTAPAYCSCKQLTAGGGRSSPPGPPLLLACARHPHQHTANALAVQLVRELGFFRTARTGPASTACACVSELLLLLNSTAQRGL